VHPVIVLDKLGTLQEQIFSTVAESFYSKHLSICHHRYQLISSQFYRHQADIRNIASQLFLLLEEIQNKYSNRAVLEL